MMRTFKGFNLGSRHRRGSMRGTVVFLAVLLAITVLGCGKDDRAAAGGHGDSPKEETPVSTTPPNDGEGAPAGRPVGFYQALDSALARRGMRRGELCDVNDEVARRILEDYGAIYLAVEAVRIPPVCMFTDAATVDRFQSEAKFTRAVVSGTTIELQPAAMEALRIAGEEARAQGLRITPRGGSEAGRRGYDDTLRLWNSRFHPALAHWQKAGRLSKADADRLRSLPIREQVREVLNLEKRGIYFSKDLSKSILYSVAAPGTSQHMSMLALDVTEFADARVRRILANHGWFQTVKSDLPHFTYLGRKESELPQLGLRRVTFGGQTFWIPDTTGQ